MARSRLIPTEATPVSSRAATPEQSATTATTSKTSKVRAVEPSTIAAAAPRKPNKARPSQVANGFIALPVALESSIPGLQNVTQHIYLRRKTESGNEDATQQPASSTSTGSSNSNNTIFAVNLPYGSTEAIIKQGIEDLIKARTGSVDGNNSTATGKGKGKASDLSNGSVGSVESVEFVQSSISHRSDSILEREGIVHPSTLLKKQELEQLLNMENLSKKQKKALHLQQQQQQQQLEELDSEQGAKNRIHPLFVSADITTKEALDHLFPNSSTLKAHITLSSVKAVQLLLNEKVTSSWSMTTWPSTAWKTGESLETKTETRTRDEILFDVARPSAESVKLHVDDWMKVFDEANPNRAASARRAAELAAEEASQPKSKRAQAREAAAKAAKQADYARKKAIKKRRIYDDDFDEPEADADGWITVTAGGMKGRSAADGGDDEDDQFDDEDEIRQAELEGFVSGKRSVGIARKDFVKDKERELAEERKKALAALNNKLGIDTGSQNDDASMAIDGSGVLPEEDEDVSRGGGRGRKKKMKKSRGIEVNMYGFQRRQESKKSEFLPLTSSLWFTEFAFADDYLAYYFRHLRSALAFRGG